MSQKVTSKDAYNGLVKYIGRTAAEHGLKQLSENFEAFGDVRFVNLGLRGAIRVCLRVRCLLAEKETDSVHQDTCRVLRLA